MARKTHKRQRKQNGGYDYISSKTEILRKIVNLDTNAIKSDNQEYLITKEGFESSLKGSYETIRTQLIEYITVLYTIIVGDKGGPALTSYFEETLVFPNLPEGSTRSEEFEKIRLTGIVEDGKPQSRANTEWFKRFIDNYSLATSLYNGLLSEEERKEIIIRARRKIIELREKNKEAKRQAELSDDLPGIPRVYEESASVAQDPKVGSSGDPNEGSSGDPWNTKSPYNSSFGGKIKEKSNRKKSNRKKSNRKKSNRKRSNRRKLY
jgi:hypothetical protein